MGESSVRKLDQLDWARLSAIRGFAAILVTFGHLEQIFLHPLSDTFSKMGSLLAQSSVMMFFVVSGCSIASSADQAMSGPSPVRRYTVSRVARIMPPLLFAVALMWALSFAAPHLFPSGTAHFMEQEKVAREGYFNNPVDSLGALLFLNGFLARTPNSNGPLWSLSYEVWLYVVFFLAYLFVVRRKLRYGLAAGAIFFVLAVLDRSGSQELFLKYAIVWSCGAAIYFMSPVLRKKDLIGHHRMRYVALLALSLFAGLAILFAVRFDSAKDASNPTSFNLCFGIAFATYLLLIRPSRPACIQKVFSRAAAFGYTLYLIHFPIFLFAFGVFQSWAQQSYSIALLVGIAAWIFTIVAAFSASLVVEKRTLFLRPLTSTDR